MEEAILVSFLSALLSIATPLLCVVVFCIIFDGLDLFAAIEYLELVEDTCLVCYPGRRPTF